MNKITSIKKFGKWLAIIYLSLPFFAGMLGSHNPDGPKIYPEDYHVIPYEIGRFLIYQKSAPKGIAYDRPWFYFGRRKCSKIFEVEGYPLYSHEF